MKTRYREILRLKALGVTDAEAAAGAGCSASTVARTLRLAKDVGLEWPLPDEMGDEQLGRILHPAPHARRGGWAEPDWERVHRELARKGVTRALLYEEYCDSCQAAGETPCSSTTFNRGYAEWASAQNVTMHIERKPGEKMEVDWAGTKMALVERATGEVSDVYVFVACMPFSGKLFAEGFLSMDSESWLAAHVHALDFYGGVPAEIVPDNCKTAVTRNRRGEEPLINRSYLDLAGHYGCAIVPTRVRRPRDKANVEAGVGIVTRRAIAALRDRTFLALGEPDAALAEKAGEINTARFARKPGSRGGVFESQERGALSPLPGTPFQVCSWQRATVRSNYHVPARGCFYSVPFEHVGKVADVRVTRDAVEVFVGGVRVASHPRSYVEGDCVTRAEHMPENHIAYLEWNVEGLMRRASEVGPACERAMATITGSQNTKKQSIGQGKALLALGRRYGASTLEAACASALAATGGATCAVAAVECLCEAAYRANGDVEDSGEHALLRGSGYYGRDGE